ncbi:MAG: hypothetical protein ACI9MR_000063 [Myxococcota bacterium]|jgi:hypothetical protein
MTLRKLGLLAIAALLGATPAIAADHIDSPSAVDDPTADITDLYAWTNSDASKLNLILNTVPFAAAGAEFSTDIQYVFHVNSSTAYLAPQTETTITCQFWKADGLECWVGDTYVAGDPSSAAGMTSDDGKIRVFAGMRKDPFFFSFDGFTAAINLVVGAASGLSFDGDGCPTVDEATAGAIVALLQSDGNGGAAVDTFAAVNVMSIVVEIDKTLINSGGDVMGIWASTHR